MIKLNRWLGSFRAGFLIRSDGLSLVSFVYGVISWLCKCSYISEKTARWGRAGVCCWLGTSRQMGVDRSNSCGVPHLCFFPWTTAACLHLIPCICWWFVSSSHNWRLCRVGRSKSKNCVWLELCLQVSPKEKAVGCAVAEDWVTPRYLQRGVKVLNWKMLQGATHFPLSPHAKDLTEVVESSKTLELVLPLKWSCLSFLSNALFNPVFNEVHYMGICGNLWHLFISPSFFHQKKICWRTKPLLSNLLIFEKFIGF